MFSLPAPIFSPAAEILEHCLRQIQQLLSFPPGQQLSRNIYRKHLGINEHDSISVSKHCFLVAKEIQPERTTMGSSIIVIIFDSACFLLSPLSEAPEGC